MKPLFKTTIVIWSKKDPRDLELVDLAMAADCGTSYCSTIDCGKVEDPSADPDCDGTEFFEEEKDD